MKSTLGARLQVPETAGLSLDEIQRSVEDSREKAPPAAAAAAAAVSAS